MSSRAEDLARLGHHLALLGRVVVAVLEGLDLGQDVERDLVRVDGGLDIALVEHGLGLRVQLLDRFLPGARSGLVGGHDHALDSDRIEDRLERHHHLHGGAVGVRDDALVAFQRVAVDFGHDQRDVGLHAPGARVVHDHTAGVANCGAHSRDTPPPAEKSAMSKPSIASSARARTSSWPSPNGNFLPAERSEASGTTSDASKRRSLMTASMVEPTAPVAPTTATRTLIAAHRPRARPRPCPARTCRAAPALRRARGRPRSRRRS